MSIWKENPIKDEPDAQAPDTAREKEDHTPIAPMPSADASGRTKKREPLESVIAADLTVEGKIEGSGHVRLAGKFKGDVDVDGDFTIEEGAKLDGSVRATRVVIEGELEGNVDAASNVELSKTGVVNGDLKAGSLTVASGSRMNGQVEFGNGAKELRKAPRMKVEAGSEK